MKRTSSVFIVYYLWWYSNYFCTIKHICNFYCSSFFRRKKNKEYLEFMSKWFSISLRLSIILLFLIHDALAPQAWNYETKCTGNFLYVGYISPSTNCPFLASFCLVTWYEILRLVIQQIINCTLTSPKYCGFSQD